jgi:hypothetical protein
VFFRRRRSEGDPQVVGHAASDVTTFMGVSEDPGRNVASAGTGLYEFWTDTDVPVRLHDMSFEGFDYRNDARPSLILRLRGHADTMSRERPVLPRTACCVDGVQPRSYGESSPSTCSRT